MQVEYRYIGAGAFVVGMPARDITANDLAENPEWRAEIEANMKTPTPCYEKVKQAKQPVKEGE